MIERESFWVTVMSGAAHLIKNGYEDIVASGFYIKDAVRKDGFILGPFQGIPRCLRITDKDDICLKAAEQNTVCAVSYEAEEISDGGLGDDSIRLFGAVPRGGSEIAVPVHDSMGAVIGILNVRSEKPDRFDKDIRKVLEGIAEIVENGITGMEEPGFAKYIRDLKDQRMPVKDPRVVYQGEPGAYSEIAAIDFFGKDAEIRGLNAFEDTFIALKNGEADYAVLPIENSSTGVIRQVYDLLAKYECFMVGETTVSVQHSFMVMPGTRLEEIETVFSHEQGLFQCEGFLNRHPEWKRIPQEDTAGSARMIAEMKDRSKAAICSSRAAEIYGLEVLFEGINSNSANTTRFVVISPNMEIRENSDKICISFMTPHKPGALHEVLTVFTVRGLNMVRLESRPIPEHNWEYMFFVEFTGNLKSPGMDEVMFSLAEMTDSLRVYGNYVANL